MTDYNNLPNDVKVTYTDFVECQYCGLRFGHDETAAMQNHWRDCPAEHPARVEIERLRAANARLVEACKEAVEWFEVYADEYPAHGRRVEAKLMAAVEQVENEATE